MQLTRADFLRRLVGGTAVGVAALIGLDSVLTDATGGYAPILSSTLDAEQSIAVRFVRLCHHDQSGVRALLRLSPHLAGTACPATGELPLAAAAHMCRPDIARLLLAAGAPLTSHAAAMLGQLHSVRDMLERAPALATTPGAHGITLLYHAALCGSVPLLAAVADCEPRQDYTAALHGAAWRGQTRAARWLLDRGADARALVLRREQRTLHRLPPAAA